MKDYLTLLQEQIDKNRRINELAKRERDAIAVRDISVVMESDAIRKEIVSQLKSLQPEMDCYLTKIPGTLDQLPLQLKGEIVAACKELEGLITETITIDRENEGKLKEFKTALGEKIKEVSRGKRALSGYRSPAEKTPKLFDGAV